MNTARLGWLPLSLAAGASGVFYFASTGLGPLWPLAWLAPLPVLVVAPRTSWALAMLVAFAAYASGTLNEFDYLMQITRGDLRSALIAQTSETLAVASGFALVVVLTRMAMLRLSPWLAAFAFPALFTAYEYAFSTSPLTGTLFSIANTQIDFLPVLQIASLTGIWGIVFLVSLVPSALAVFWGDRQVIVLAPTIALAAAALIFGAVRLQAPAGAPVSVGAAASDADGDPRYPQPREDMRKVVAAYVDRVHRLAAGGAQVVVLPEKIVGVAAGDVAGLTAMFADAARASHVTLIAGVAAIDGAKRRNIALVFGPDGEPLGIYQKHHLVFGAESVYAGGNKIMTLAHTYWGVAICKDLDFPAWMRRYGEADVRLLAVPAWDFDLDGRLRARVAVLRGVENGYAVARAAKQGRVTLSDAYGRVIAERVTTGAPEALAIAAVPTGPGATFYARFGDWFAWLAAAAAIVLLSASFVTRRVEWRSQD